MIVLEITVLKVSLKNKFFDSAGDYLAVSDRLICSSLSPSRTGTRDEDLTHVSSSRLSERIPDLNIPKQFSPRSKTAMNWRTNFERNKLSRISSREDQEESNTQRYLNFTNRDVN